jgi:hypothetical protein
MTAIRATLVVACAAFAGCASPEATRTRGGGPGADVGNRPTVVKMHEGSQPFWKTPERIVGEHAPLESARQADALSRRATGSGQGPSTGSGHGR